MDNVIDITPLLDAQKAVVDAEKIAEAILEGEGLLPLEKWLKDGNGRNADPFDPPRK